MRYDLVALFAPCTLELTYSRLVPIAVLLCQTYNYLYFSDHSYYESAACEIV